MLEARLQAEGDWGGQMRLGGDLEHVWPQAASTVMGCCTPSGLLEVG